MPENSNNSAVSPRLPELQQPEADAFDTRPTSVRDWVANLPMADRGEATRRIYQVLREVNRLAVPAKQRFEFMERLGEPLTALLPAINRHFIDKGFPLSERYRRIARLSTELQSEMLLGYRLLLEEEQGSSWLARRSLARQSTVASHRLFRYFGTMLRNYQLLNLAVPEGLWREMHALYRRSRTNGTLQKRTVWFDEGGHETSIEDEYKRLLLLSLSSPYHLRPAQMEELYSHVGYWLGYVQLRDSTKVTGENTCAAYAVDLEGNTPPRALGLLREQEHGELLTVDCSALQGLFTEWLGRLERGEPGVPITADTIHALSEGWCKAPRRGEDERQPGDGALDVAIGMRDVHRVTQNGVLHPPEQQEADDDVESALSLDELHALELEFDELGEVANYLREAHSDDPDVAEIPLGDELGDGLAAYFPELADTSATGAADRETLNIAGQTFVVQRGDAVGEIAELGGVETAAQMVRSASVVDFSTHGYCLAQPVDGEVSTRAGDVIAVREDDHFPWQVGDIRWLREAESGDLLLGVRIVLHTALPVELIRQGNSGEAAIPALMGKTAAGESALYIPHLPGNNRNELHLDYCGQRGPIRLLKRLYRSPLYSVYAFEMPAPPADAALLSTNAVLLGTAGEDEWTLEVARQPSPAESPQEETEGREAGKKGSDLSLDDLIL